LLRWIRTGSLEVSHRRASKDYFDKPARNPFVTCRRLFLTQPHGSRPKLSAGTCVPKTRTQVPGESRVRDTHHARSTFSRAVTYFAPSTTFLYPPRFWMMGREMVHAPSFLRGHSSRRHGLKSPENRACVIHITHDHAFMVLPGPRPTSRPAPPSCTLRASGRTDTRTRR
jgi:hypothetical protein